MFAGLQLLDSKQTTNTKYRRPYQKYWLTAR
jgi:hypothetical protein